MVAMGKRKNRRKSTKRSSRLFNRRKWRSVLVGGRTMKDLKRLLLTLFWAALVIIALDRLVYTMAMLPQWQTQQIEEHTLDMMHQEKQAPANDAMWIMIKLGIGGGVLIVFLGAPVVLYSLMFKKREDSDRRAKDGSLPLIHKVINGVLVVIDPNKMSGPLLGIDQQTGQAAEYINPVFGADRQLAMNKSVQKTRTANASVGDGGIKYAAHGRFLSDYYERNERLDTQPVEALPAPPIEPLTLQEAFDQSTREEWIMGQNHQTGELYKVNMKEGASFGIVGAKGCGKTTYSAYLMMAYAVSCRYRVILLDGKGGADWKRFSPWAEYYTLTTDNIMPFVQRLEEERQFRQERLNQEDANSIWELKGTRPKPTLVILDEFGKVWSAFKIANQRTPLRYQQLEQWLSDLIRLGRSAGIYIIIVDQNPKKWPDNVKANFPVNICYRMGGGLGAVLQEHNLDSLEPKGHFMIDGVDYHSWPTWEAMDILLPPNYKKPRAFLEPPTITGELHEPREPSSEGVGGVNTQKRLNLPPIGGELAQAAQAAHTPVEPGSDAGSPPNSWVSAEPPVAQPEPAPVQPAGPLLTGDIQTEADIAVLREAFARNNGSVNATCREVWGDKQPISFATQKRRVNTYCKPPQ